jgi:DNA helicase-2/ATP-dependent DNA helicase PcrA
MSILDGLNPEQLEAVRHVDGPMLVVAGAGTGKTQVITKRIAYLIAEGHAKPSQVLALTFTEKAAREMEDRLYHLIGWESFQVPIMTFHAFGTELLSRYASHIGRSIRGGLLNETQKALLLEQHLDRVHFKYYGHQDDGFEFVGTVIAYINELQNAAITAASYLEYVQDLRENPADMHPHDIDEHEDLATLYALYEELKAETGTFDYNDQLELPLQILRTRPNLAQRLAQEYMYVLVDEYQDTNAVQDALLRSFIPSGGNIFAVGDDDQAIYGFRGADVANILDFSQHFRVEESLALVRNYRSGQAILDASYQLIQHNNPERLESKLGISKRLIARTTDIGQVEFTHYKDAQDELYSIAKRLEKDSAGIAASNLAVLASTHAPLKNLARLLRRLGIPYSMSTSLDIFEQPEIIGLWYLMKWLCMKADDETIGHVIMGPLISWSPEMYRRIASRSTEAMIPVEDALRSDEHEDSVHLISNLDAWRSWALEFPVSHLAFKLVFETELADQWRKVAEEKPRMIRVFEDLQKWLEQMQDFESVAENTSASQYMTLFPKPPSIEVSEPVGEEGGVQLLTVHSSKGLEFDSVYLINCTQRSWSSSGRATKEIPEKFAKARQLPVEHEYRRLMYVAVTRAKKNLFVSAPAAGPSGTKLSLSPLVHELMDVTPVPNSSSIGLDIAQQAFDRVQGYYPLRDGLMVDSNKMPFEDAEGWMNLNVTQLSQYEYCPFEFYVTNVLQIKQLLGPQVNFGNVVHKVIERHNKAKLSGGDVSEQELHTLLDELWSDKGYRHRDIAHHDRELAHQTLATFLLRSAQSNDRIVASERPIKLEIPEARLRLKGKMDAVFERADGVEIRDYKTGRNKTDVDKLSKSAKTNSQLRTYALAYESDHGVAPAAVTLDYVVTGVEGTALLTPAILRNHRERLGTLADKIRNRQFEPNSSPMHQCAAIKYYGTGEQDELVELSVVGERK